MKKFAFAAVALMVLAGSTFTVPATSDTTLTLAVVTQPKPPASPDTIPPPSCPVDDPNGCGILS